MKTINMMLKENWINDSNFSSNIWDNKEKLGNYLKTNLTASTLSGKSIQRISRELEEYMNAGLYNATRLARTEVNHFANESEMLSYEECGIEKYRFIATLDKVTCEHCAELDNEVFYVKDRKAGKNCPPIHPNDRCTTVAEFEDDETEDLQRRAKDENGKTILVPQDMDYQTWKKKYIDNPNSKSPYKDITNTILEKNQKEYAVEQQQYFIDEKGNKYVVDNKYVLLEPTQREIEVANMLGEIYGGKIKIIPRINKPSNIKTPDYMIEDKKLDLKQITGGGKYTIEGNLKGKKEQAQNFIIDITNAKLDQKEAEKQIQTIYNSKRYSWIDSIMLIKEKEFLKIYKRK